MSFIIKLILKMFTYYVADILKSGAIPVNKTDKNPYLPPRKED